MLCAAASLCNGDTIHQVPRESVTYYHIMFDRHEVVFAEDAPSESSLYGDYLCRDGSAVQRELAALFPELDSQTAAQPARPILRTFESQVLAMAA